MAKEEGTSKGTGKYTSRGPGKYEEKVDNVNRDSHLLKDSLKKLSKNVPESVYDSAMETIGKYSDEDAKGIIARRLCDASEKNKYEVPRLVRALDNKELEETVGKYSGETARALVDNLIMFQKDLEEDPEIRKEVLKAAKVLGDETVVNSVKRYSEKNAPAIMKELAIRAGSTPGKIKKMAKVLSDKRVVENIDQYSPITVDSIIGDLGEVLVSNPKAVPDIAERIGDYSEKKSEKVGKYRVSEVEKRVHELSDKFKKI